MSEVHHNPFHHLWTQLHQRLLKPLSIHYSHGNPDRGRGGRGCGIKISSLNFIFERERHGFLL